jgi:uncharacterized protein (TIGR03663 family)
VASAAFYVRVMDLEARPMHGDEANQAVKTGILLETGEYIYDPHDHHGPTLYFAAALSARLAGAADLAETTEFTFRIVPVLFAVATVLLLLFLGDGIGRPAVFCAAVLLTIAPAAVYYSRYFIQEALLVFFTLFTIGAAWRYTRKPGWGWALATGLSLGLMHGTKETWILALFAMVTAVPLTVLWTKWREGRTIESRAFFCTRHIVGGFALGTVVAFLLFSVFFTQWRGPLDSLLTYGNYVQRAGGAGLHDKPWYYYLALLAYFKRGLGAPWSEAFVLIMAAVGIAAALWEKETTDRRLALPRFLAFYTAILIAVYSIIPYKTPWSMLTFYHGLIILAGYGAVRAVFLARFRPVQITLALAIMGGAYHLAQQTTRANVTYPADTRNPYVYAHTSTAVKRLAKRLEDLAIVHPRGRSMLIMVIEPDGDYWPLPWYTRGFDRIGYSNVPETFGADVIIASPAIAETLSEASSEEYMIETHGLRPGVLLQALIRRDLWDRFIESRS